MAFFNRKEKNKLSRGREEPEGKLSGLESRFP